MPLPNLSSEEYRLIVEQASMMIWRADSDGKVDYVNQAWLDFTGRPIDQELGDGWLGCVHPEDQDRCRAAVRGCSQYAEPFEIVFRLRRHDGEYRYVSQRGAPLPHPNGGAAGVVATSADIDDRRRADDAKTTFLAMLAHELRTPLTPMGGYVHQMERRIKHGEPILIETVQKLGRQVDRIRNLVDHLSDAARVNAGKAMGIAVDQLDLTALVREIVDKHGKSGELTRRTELVLEGVQGERIIHADGVRLRQLLRHLITNAIKFSPRGGVITVHLESSPFEHVVSVADRGIGIPSGDLPEVTKAYYRASNASPENYPGIGLGLAIAREIAEAHGGSLRVESSVDNGTQVIVRLPAASAEA